MEFQRPQEDRPPVVFSFKLPLRLPLYTDLVQTKGGKASDHTIRESEVTMKRKLIVTLTGIAMSMALAVTGCAGTTGAAGTSGSASSETNTQTAKRDSTDAKTPSDSQQDTAEANASKNKPKEGTTDGSGTGKPSGKKPKGSSSEEATAALKTVEPSTYAGQTVYGKVTAINDSQITVTLGTYNKEASVTQTSAATEETELTDAVATTTDQNADPTAESADAGTKKKKSRFTASDEQMTITIPESLAGIEIKEKYVLAITLDDNGSVTALEVASKGHSKSKGASSGEKGAGQEKAPSSGDSAELNTDETTDL